MFSNIKRKIVYFPIIIITSTFEEPLYNPRFESVEMLEKM